MMTAASGCGLKNKEPPARLNERRRRSEEEERRKGKGREGKEEKRSRLIKSRNKSQQDRGNPASGLRLKAWNLAPCHSQPSKSGWRTFTGAPYLSRGKSLAFRKLRYTISSY
jgi:hypothetical protein